MPRGLVACWWACASGLGTKRKIWPRDRVRAQAPGALPVDDEGILPAALGRPPRLRASPATPGAASSGAAAGRCALSVTPLVHSPGVSTELTHSPVDDRG